jgi:hypothetical protein
MKITIQFYTDDASFEDDFHEAIKHALDQAKKKIRVQLKRPKSLCDAPEAADKIIDVNGNTIGYVSLE